MEFFPPGGIRLFRRKLNASFRKRSPCFSAVAAALLLCIAPSQAGAEGFASRRVLSFDLGYLGTGLKNNGWGLGLSYEASLISRFAVKGGFSHMTMMPANSGMTVTTVGVQLEALCYPFGRGLDWLYIGAGCGTDFFMYKGGSVLDSERNDALVSLLGEIGWKQNFFDYVMADAFFGYRYPLNRGVNAFSGEIVRQGFEYGVRFKLNIPMIFRRIFRKRGAAVASSGESDSDESMQSDENGAAADSLDEEIPADAAGR